MHEKFLLTVKSRFFGRQIEDVKGKWKKNTFNDLEKLNVILPIACEGVKRKILS